MKVMPELSAQDLPYTNREIREKWHETSTTLQEISNKVTLTNGRVTQLELDKASQGGFYKAMAIVGVIGWGIGMSLIGWMLLQLTTLDSRIQLAVDKALSAYNVTP